MIKNLAILFAFLLIKGFSGFQLPEPDKVLYYSDPKTHVTPVSQWNVESGMVTLPKASGRLQIYALPLGEGDSTIVQCPSGEIIVLDMGQGSKYNDANTGWNVDMVKAYMRYSTYQVTTIVITHPGTGHYNFIPEVFTDTSTTKLERIILAGKKSDYTDSTFLTWLNKRLNIVEYVNSENPCISECLDTPPVCNGGNDGVTFEYLGANLGNSQNGRSLIISIIAMNFKMLLPGDFEGQDIECLLVNEWSIANLDVKHTHLKLSRHGGYNDSNSQKFLNAIQPKLAFVSNTYPTSPSYHPSCEVITRVLSTGSIKKRSNVATFACGDYSSQKCKQYNSWPYEIYSTSPTQGENNIISFVASPCS